MTEQDKLMKVIAYMKAHWPSKVKPEWQVGLDEYPVILGRVMADFTKGKSQGKHFVRIAGLSGSGKTTQLLPAVEEYFAARELAPVLVAARRFVEYHPHYAEILDCYGEENVRKMTDEFSTIMMFLTLAGLTREGYDMILDVTLLDPEMEGILMGMLGEAKYETLLTIIAIAPEVAEQHLGGRAWRHTRETELEFVRATRLALEYYAREFGGMRMVVWNVFDTLPVYDGAVAGGVETFNKFSTLTDIPPHDESALREAKIKYLRELSR